MRILQRLSPNFDARAGVPISMLVLHYTGMPSGAEALERLCDPEAKVSAHYLVEEDGTVFQLVEEKERAWHAGKSYWRGIDNVNAASIGIEIVNPGHEWGYRDFPTMQMRAVAEVAKGVVERHGIAARDVVGHSDVAPLRKSDPGERFDWRWLAGQGVGLWADTPDRADGTAWDGDRERLRHRLTRYGYRIGEDAEEAAVIRAFQRHFRPEAVTGAWDDLCEARLDALLAVA